MQTTLAPILVLFLLCSLTISSKEPPLALFSNFYSKLFPTKTNTNDSYNNILSIFSVSLYLCYPIILSQASGKIKNLWPSLVLAVFLGYLLPSWIAPYIPKKTKKLFVFTGTLCALVALPIKKFLSLLNPQQMEETPAPKPKAAITQEFNHKLEEALISFEDLIVREVMVPKIDIFALPEETPIREAMDKIISEGYSRIPIYKKSVDSITGIVLVKDLLTVLRNCHPEKTLKPLSSIAKPAMFTPEIKKATLMLQDFRQQRKHLAIVVNEYGYTEGIVTMEDIIEEIIGEISDEHDSKEDLPYRKSGNSWIVDGRMNISDAEELFQLHIDHENSYDTLGGHVFHKLGAVPQKGMKLNHEQFDIEIISCSDRSIGKLKITPLKKSFPED
ncbi:transporter associated domain-containing protein [Chlamydiifrater phoenicopteri]|uniref:transporter associated domain-containing protein n=1 Tax=Chlamydiifrater phoenicopteri TaxID=2681469 RepID=UPI001BCEEA34|nr:transporter associated domain-containing protein [Chlamydiifrater phoenicopteri]